MNINLQPKEVYKILTSTNIPIAIQIDLEYIRVLAQNKDLLWQYLLFLHKKNMRSKEPAQAEAFQQAQTFIEQFFIDFFWYMTDDGLATSGWIKVFKDIHKFDRLAAELLDRGSFLELRLALTHSKIKKITIIEKILLRAAGHGDYRISIFGFDHDTRLCGDIMYQTLKGKYPVSIQKDILMFFIRNLHYDFIVKYLGDHPGLCNDSYLMKAFYDHIEENVRIQNPEYPEYDWGKIKTFIFVHKKIPCLIPTWFSLNRSFEPWRRLDANLNYNPVILRAVVCYAYLRLIGDPLKPESEAIENEIARYPKTYRHFKSWVFSLPNLNLKRNIQMGFIPSAQDFWVESPEIQLPKQRDEKGKWKKGERIWL